MGAVLVGTLAPWLEFAHLQTYLSRPLAGQGNPPRREQVSLTMF